MFLKEISYTHRDFIWLKNTVNCIIQKYYCLKSYLPI